jgi:TRAP-type C4-dicarboxylate transport system permease small subunit
MSCCEAVLRLFCILLLLSIGLFGWKMFLQACNVQYTALGGLSRDTPQVLAGCATRDGHAV